MPDRTLSTVRNAVRALAVLAEQGPLRLTPLAAQLGLGKSTAHLLLQTLAADGMVEVDPVSGAYRVGLRAFEIGATAIEQGGFGARLIGAMEELGRRCNESVSLGVLSAGSVLIVQRVESPEILRADIRPGTRMPLHASASGKVLLAAMPEREVRQFLPESLTASARKTHRDRGALLAELKQVRAQGFAGQSDEFVDGIAAVAAPVYAAGGKVLAALSIAGPAARFDEARWVDLLLPAAAEMSLLSGHVPRATGFVPNGRAGAAAVGAVASRKEDRAPPD
jgi:IclR family transcriptional regulator, acetate operon repressor